MPQYSSNENQAPDRTEASNKYDEVKQNKPVFVELAQYYVGENGNQHKYFRPYSKAYLQRQTHVLYEQSRNSYTQALTIKRKETKLRSARSEDVGTRNSAHFHQFKDHDIFINQNYQSYESENLQGSDQFYKPPQIGSDNPSHRHPNRRQIQWQHEHHRLRYDERNNSSP